MLAYADTTALLAFVVPPAVLANARTAALFALAAPPAVLAYASTAAILALVAPPAVLAFAGVASAALLHASGAPPAVLALVALADAAGRNDARRRSARLHPPCARRRHADHGRKLLLVGVVGVVARLRSRPALARPGRRRHLMEAGVAVGQRAAEGAAKHCPAAESLSPVAAAFESRPVSLS